MRLYIIEGFIEMLQELIQFSNKLDEGLIKTFQFYDYENPVFILKMNQK